MNKYLLSRKKNISIIYMGQVSGKDVGQAYNTVGTAAVWWKIISCVISSIICICVLIFFNFFYMAGWKKTKALVLYETCENKIETRKSGRGVGGARRTKEVEVTQCEHEISFIHDGTEYKTYITGSERLLDELYEEDDNDDDVEVDIEYDPKNPGENASFPFPRYIINLIAGVILIISILAGIFWYVMRKNRIAKGFAIIGAADNVFD